MGWEPFRRAQRAQSLVLNVGMALLTWMGVAALVPLVAHHLGKMLQTAQRGIAKAWQAGQSRLTSEEQDIDDAGKLLGEAVGEFFVAFLEGLVMWVLKGEAVSSTKGSVAKLANPKAVMERQALLSARINEMYIMLRNSRLGPRFAEWFRSNINGVIEWYQKRHAQPATSGVEETAATRAPSRGSAGADLAKTEINGITPVRVRPGTNGKVAVVGRSMGSGVEPYASGLKARGYDVETFSGDQVSEGAQNAWQKLIDKYKPNRVPDDAIQNSEMYQENQAWAQKLADQNYTVVDIGDPSGQGPSAFVICDLARRN